MEKSLQHLDFIIEHCRTTVNYFDKREDLNSTQLFCIGLLERFSNSSVALKTMLEKLNANLSLEYGCGIVLRSMLLDTLIVLNLQTILIENEASNQNKAEKEQRVKEFCEIVLSDGLEQTLRYIKTAQEVGIITKQQLINTYQNFVAGRQRFFEPYSNDESMPVVKTKKYYGPADLFKRIAANPELKELSKIYDAYLFFSKYDHFGILYYEVSRHKAIEKLERISKSIEVFILAQSILHLALRLSSNDDTFLNR